MISLLKREQAIQINIKPEILLFRIEFHSPLPPVAMVARILHRSRFFELGRIQCRGRTACSKGLSWLFLNAPQRVCSRALQIITFNQTGLLI